MKKLVCGAFGNIYWATILKEGRMSLYKRVDVTVDAVNCVAQHLMEKVEFNDSKLTGYSFELKNGGKLQLIAFDPEVYRLVPVEDKEVEE